MAAGPAAVYGRSMSTHRAVLVIADIGGYTEYMQFHRSVLGHAEAATSRMLGQVVSAARGFELDTLFTQLMINHHAGGVHMAATAAKTAEEQSTRRWAAAMDDGQRGEISEMNTWRTKHGLPTIVPPLAEFSN